MNHIVRRAIGRGFRGRCPHCGQGRLFAGREHIARCASCGLIYERNQGDTWAFTIIGDRIPVVVGVAVVYFGVARSHRVIGMLIFALMAITLIWTAPNRWGVGIALHYLSRVYWPDPADPIPDEVTDPPGP